MNRNLTNLVEALVFVHGTAADAEAARQAALCDKLSDRRTADLWRDAQRILLESRPRLAA